MSKTLKINQPQLASFGFTFWDILNDWRRKISGSRSERPEITGHRTRGRAPGGSWFHGFALTLLVTTSTYAVQAEPSTNSPVHSDGTLPTTMLRVDASGHFLVDRHNKPVFLMADTAWSLVVRLKREEITEYLQRRKSQGFNAVAFVIYSPRNSDICDNRTNANVYGDLPFEKTAGQVDPTKPWLTKGADSASEVEYDFWDHVDFAMAELRRLKMYAFVLPCWGNEIASRTTPGQPGSGPSFDEASARHYGHWLGMRYRDEPHIVWMMGGDRSAVDPKTGDDYRSVFRAMAEGIRSSGHRGLISYHPQKAGKQSGDWFHEDRWLGFNSIQLWPEAQIDAITRDWNATPSKPTWLFEGRYEAYWKRDYKESDWGAWQVRQQAWQTVLAGAFGHTYGHERVFGFGCDGTDWRSYLDAPGAQSMTHLVRFMQLLDSKSALIRIPDQSLVIGDAGKAERLTSNRVTASRTADGTVAVFYIANGRSFSLNRSRLADVALKAYWFNPRNGKWQAAGIEYDQPTPFAVDTAKQAFGTELTLDPPGEPGLENDWVLLLKP